MKRPRQKRAAPVVSTALSAPGGRAAPPSRRALLFCLLAGSLALPASAQPDADGQPELLAPWIVEAAADQAQPAAHTDPFASALGPTSVIDPTAFASRRTATLAEALRGTPGVVLQESFGGFEPPRLSIRGSGLDSAPSARGVALLLDGLPLARADGIFNSSLFDPALFARVEVYRGTLHTALTPLALGGALNALGGSPAAAPAFLRADAGARGYAHAQLATPIGATTALAVSAVDAGGEREHSAQHRLAARAATRHALTREATLDLSAYAARAVYDVPGPLTLAAATSSPRLASAAVWRDLPRREASLVHVAAQLAAPLGEGTLTAGLAGQHGRDEFFQLQANGTSATVADDVSGHLTWSRPATLGPFAERRLVRFTGSTGATAVERFLNVNGARGASFGAFDTRAATFALSVEELVWLTPALAVGAGGTAVEAHRDLRGRAAPALAENLAFRDFSPRAGALCTLSPRLALHAAVSRGIEPPTFDDLVNVTGSYPSLSLAAHSLAAQSATTLEAGAQGVAGRVSWSVTVYRAAWRHEILRLADAAGQPRGAVNAARTIHEGVESALRWRALTGAHRLTLDATATLGRFTFDADPVYGRNRLAGAPPLLGQAELRYDSPRHFFAAAESTWTAGATPVDHANRLRYGGAALFHFRSGMALGRATVFVSVHNVFDRSSVASTAGVLDVARNPAATAVFLPGVGRALAVGCAWKL